jgi:hypothetical protein
VQKYTTECHATGGHVCFTLVYVYLIARPALPCHAGDEWGKLNVRVLRNTDRREMFYADITIINDRTFFQREHYMRVLVDTSLNAELIIPSDTACKLGLSRRGQCKVAGYEEGIVDMEIYAPVLVKLQYKDPDLPHYLARTYHTFREADLTVMSTYARSSEIPQNVLDFKQFVTPEGHLKLKPAVNTHYGDGVPVLGSVGLQKLGLSVNSEGLVPFDIPMEKSEKL